MSSRTGIMFTTFCLLFVIMTTGQTQTLPEELQGNPCSKPSSIKLPTSNKCLVLVKEGMDWTTSQTTCERAGGSLYKMPSALLYTRPRLMDCLSSYNGSDFTDLWLNGVSLWSPQFLWTNGTYLNNVTYCPRELPPTEGTAITSDYLSVDYCVSTCHDQGARFTVLYSTGKSPKCNCIHNLDPKYAVACDSSSYSYQDRSRFYIVHSKENSLIKVGSGDAFSSTEIMCATVNIRTLVNREMRSDTCFTQRPFLCELGTADECKEAKAELECQGKECFFICGNKCLKRVNLPYNWYAAKSYCSSKGGDLWLMNELDDMKQVAQYLDQSSHYWIGATNYVWEFNATSRSLANLDTTYTKVQCGHMIRELTTGSLGRRWTWGDTTCSQEKSFLCEFDDHQFKSSEREQNVSCPWTIIYPDVVTLGPIDPPVTNFQTVVRDSSFPIAAVIAGIIAGLILLTCLGLAFAFCGRRHWGKVREHLTFIPYFSDNGHAVMGNSHEFENMSQVGGMGHSRSHMSSVSEHGSQTGLVKGGYSSYATHQESNGMYSSKSLDRRHVDSMGQKLADSQNYLASANNSMDERGFAATYATMPSKQKEYMTLQAHMDIQDEAQLQAMRRSLRGKPEMALVTDNADMNLTINHASSVNGTVVGDIGHSVSTGNGIVIGNGGGSVGNGIVIGNGSGHGTLAGNGIVIEETTLPAVSEGGVILTFPERVQEAHLYTTSSPTIQVQHQYIS